MITVSRVSHSFAKGEERLAVLDDISFRVDKPEVISLVGPSGCGKSTLLKVLGGLLTPSQGEVTYGGNPAEVALSEREFGFVFQKPTLLPWRTALQNVALPTEIIDGSPGLEKAREMLATVGLSDFENSRPRQLSGGMEQRVAIARALVNDPSILFMDEPFAAVDDLTRDDLNRLMHELAAKKPRTVFFVTHSIPEAVYLSDRVMVMSSRPMHIKEVVEIDFTNRADLSIRESAAFQEKVRCIREALVR